MLDSYLFAAYCSWPIAVPPAVLADLFFFWHLLTADFSPYLQTFQKQLPKEYYRQTPSLQEFKFKDTDCLEIGEFASQMAEWHLSLTSGSTQVSELSIIMLCDYYTCH